MPRVDQFRHVAADQPILVDFDGVLHDSKHPAPGRRMGPPLPGAVEAVQRLFDDGHRIIIFTARGANKKTIAATEDWLGYFGVPYHEITNIKPLGALAIIDDRAIRFTTWTAVMRELGYHQTFQEALWQFIV